MAKSLAEKRAIHAAVEIDGWRSGLLIIQDIPDLLAFNMLVDQSPLLVLREAAAAFRLALQYARSFHLVQRKAWIICIWRDRTDSVSRSLVQEIFHVADTMWLESGADYTPANAVDRAMLTSIIFQTACDILEREWKAQGPECP